MIRALLTLTATIVLCSLFAGCDSDTPTMSAAERAEHEKAGPRPTPPTIPAPGSNLSAGSAAGSNAPPPPTKQD